MQSEIEAKFLHVKHDFVRAKLKKLGGVCEHPMRLMQRILFDYPDNRFQKNGQTQRLRVRDEGDKVVINYKSQNQTNYPYEIETTVGSYDDTVSLLKAIGLVGYSYQQSKRETWHYKDVEIVLDEWPWLDSYIEIEGPSEASIQSAAHDLGFTWDQAKFGAVETAYRDQYPGMKTSESIGELAEVCFGKPTPDFLKDRQTI